MNGKYIINLEKMSSLFIFLLVFSFFNDNFMVEHFGESSLKVLFIIFFLFYGLQIIKIVKQMNLFQDKLFFLYAIGLTVVFLLENIIDLSDDLFKNTLTLISLFVVVIYFSRYPLHKLLYFVWISVMSSIVMSFFNDPLTEWTFRTTGGTGDPNEFAAQVVALLFVSIYLFNVNKNKLFLLTSVIFVIYGIFVAGSKTSFIILAFMSALVIIKYITYDIKKIINYKTLMILAGIFFAASQIQFSEIQAVKNIQKRAENSGTFEKRVAAWNGGYYMTIAHPFLGVGLGDYHLYTRKYASVYAEATHPHNIYIKLVGESGIIVLLLFLFFLLTIFLENIKVMLRSNVFWIYIAFLSLLLMGMTLGITYDKYFLLFIAIMLNINYLIKQKRRRVNDNFAHYT